MSLPPSSFQSTAQMENRTPYAREITSDDSTSYVQSVEWLSEAVISPLAVSLHSPSLFLFPFLNLSGRFRQKIPRRTLYLLPLLHPIWPTRLLLRTRRRRILPFPLLYPLRYKMRRLLQRHPQTVCRNKSQHARRMLASRMLHDQQGTFSYYYFPSWIPIHPSISSGMSRYQLEDPQALSLHPARPMATSNSCSLNNTPSCLHTWKRNKESPQQVSRRSRLGWSSRFTVFGRT